MSSEDNTTLGGNRSFEERIFARFDAINERLNSMDARLEKLEAKSYDTKPIWERALAGIVEVRNDIEKMDVRLDRIESEVKQTHSELYTLRADFKEFRGHFKEPA